MKARSTVLRERQRLRKFIDATMPDDRCVMDAYAMETALQWVLETCAWTPLSIVTTDHEDHTDAD